MALKWWALYDSEYCMKTSGNFKNIFFFSCWYTGHFFVYKNIYFSLNYNVLKKKQFFLPYFLGVEGRFTIEHFLSVIYFLLTKR